MSSNTFFQLNDIDQETFQVKPTYEIELKLDDGDENKIQNFKEIKQTAGYKSEKQNISGFYQLADDQETF